MRAAIHLVTSFHAVADDSAPTMSATGREGLNRTLEAVEGMRLAGHSDREGFIVVIATEFTRSHIDPP